MKSITICFDNNYLTATEPAGAFLLLSMLAYTPATMLHIIDDDGSEVLIRLTRL